jgi:hypothetical protein
MQRPLPDNIQHSKETDLHALGGIRTHNLSRRAAADLHLKFWQIYIIHIFTMQFISSVSLFKHYYQNCEISELVVMFHVCFVLKKLRTWANFRSRHPEASYVLRRKQKTNTRELNTCISSACPWNVFKTGVSWKFEGVKLLSVGSSIQETTKHSFA